jgi:hypothetical protein
MEYIERGSFSKRLHKEIIPTIRMPRTKVGKEKMHERFVASLSGKRLPDDHLPIDKFSTREKYFVELHRKFYEVILSLERMSMAEKFIKRKQFAFDKIDYLRYHLEVFLNESYIFSIRFNELLEFIVSRCQKKGLNDDLVKVKGFKKKFNDSLKNLILVRGHHVHKIRYRTDKLDQLNILNSLSNEFDFIREYRDSELKETRQKILKELRDVRNNLRDFLEERLCKELGIVIFTRLKFAHRGHKRGPKNKID